MGMRVADCPTGEELERFLAGTLGAEQLDALAVHLRGCGACRARLDASAAHSALADDVRRAGREFAAAKVDVGIPAARLNELLSDYEVVAEIGRGGMGIVYRARQRSLNRIVALKVLPALVGAVRPEAMTRFRREAELAARLKHSNIIAVHDFGEVEGTLYYAMEFVEGRSLRDALRELEQTGAIDAVLTGSGVNSPRAAEGSTAIMPTLPTGSTSIKRNSTSGAGRAYYEQIARWVADVADALDYAHSQGVVHRDVKPSNLLLSLDGRIMISDFGLARGSGMESLTIDRGIVGTVRYMSPEQVDETRGPVDCCSDVYSVGATMYELLTLRPPFAGRDDREIWRAIMSDEPAPPHRLVAKVPRELETICLKALEKDRDARYATAKDLADDLRRWLLGVPILAKRQGRLVRTGKFIKRRKLPVALAAACIVLLIGAGSIYANYRAAKRSASHADQTILTQRIELITKDASLLIARDKNIEAMKRIDEGLATIPESAQLLNLRAAALMNLDRRTEALIVLNTLLAQHPNDVLGHYHAARILIGNEPLLAPGKYPEPRHPLDISAADRRSQFEYHRNEVNRLASDSEYAQVLAALDAPSTVSAIENLNRALERRPMWLEALDLRALAYEKLGDFAAMLLDYERLLTVVPDSVPYHSRRGRALLGLDRLMEAETAYSTTIAMEPKRSISWNNRSTARLRQGKAAAALSDANEAIRLDEQNAGALAARAAAYNDLGMYREALPDLGHAVRLEPRNSSHAIARACVYGNLGDFEQAMRDITHALELDPKNPRSLDVRSRILLRLGQVDRALQDLNELVRLSPSDASVYRNRAIALTSQRKLAEAIADYNQAIRIGGGKPGDFIARAKLFVATGQRDRAIADLSHLIDHDELGSEIRLRRAALYELVGDGKSAAADYAAVSREDGPLGQYATLWQYLLSRMERDSIAAERVLAGAGSETQLDPWIGKIFDTFRGKATASDLLASAATRAETCEAHYYIGMKALIDGRSADARQSFDTCVKMNEANIVESDFARARLAQLDKQNGVPKPQ